MTDLKELKYAKTHEWVRVEGDLAYIGITDFAQFHLGDIVYVELPEADEDIAKGDQLGVLESVKSVATIFSPAGGKIVKVNSELDSAPELLNQEPYEQYIAVVEMSNADELAELMDQEAYEAFCAAESSEN